MLSATYMIVGFVAIFTLGFTVLAATMLSRRKATTLDADNIKILMSYSVYDNHGGYIQEESQDNSYDEEERYAEYKYSDENKWYSKSELQIPVTQILAPVNNRQISRPAYMQFK